ncbi:MAG: LamG-like jellyroll fold domain-containing protein [Bacteroidales bacterium]
MTIRGTLVALVVSILIFGCNPNDFPPSIQDTVFTLDENSPNGTYIGTLDAFDADRDQSVFFEILEGNENNIFDLNRITGILRVADSSYLDFEEHPEFVLFIEAVDDHKNPLASTATLRVLLTDVEERFVPDASTLLLYLPFDGDSLDHSGNEVPSLVSGPIPADGRFGDAQGGMEFDGMNDFITLNNNLPVIQTDSFTISMWVKIYGDSPIGLWGNAFFEQRDNAIGEVTNGSTLYFRGDYDGNMLLHMRADGSEEVNDLKCDYAVDGGWHHYVATMDGDRMLRIYYDGELYCMEPFLFPGGFTESVDHVSLGAHHPDGILRAGLYGIMDEVILFSNALSDEEIGDLYSGNYFIDTSH